MDVCIALGVRCECQDCAVTVKMDVCIALGLRCDCHDGCVHISGCEL